MTDPGAAIQGAVDDAVTAPQAPAGDVEVEFESDRETGLVKVWTLGSFRAELKFLTQPGTGDPLDPPWFVAVAGPSDRGRVERLWSGSYDDRDAAEDDVLRHLRRLHDRHANRAPQIRALRDEDEEDDENGGGWSYRIRHEVDAAVRAQVGDLPGEMWAVFDPEFHDFVRSGFFGQVVFETRSAAESAASPGQVLVRVVPAETAGGSP